FAITAVLFAGGTALGLAAVGPWQNTNATDVVSHSATAGLLLSCAVWSAWWLQPRCDVKGIDEEWRRFRNYWGFVWSARVRQRWNAAARYYGWNMRLDWRGFQPITPHKNAAPSDEAGQTYLRHLLRRFWVHETEGAD